MVVVTCERILRGWVNIVKLQRSEEWGKRERGCGGRRGEFLNLKS